MSAEYFILCAEYKNKVGDLTITVPIKQKTFVDSDLATKECLTMQKLHPEQRFFINYITV